jgi:hypothetical protein
MRKGVVIAYLGYKYDAINCLKEHHEETASHIREWNLTPPRHVFVIFCRYGPGSSAPEVTRYEFDFWQRQELAPSLEPTEHLIERVPAAESRSWPLTYIRCWIEEWVELCLQSPTLLHTICRTDDSNSLHFGVQNIVMVEEGQAGGIFIAY